MKRIRPLREPTPGLVDYLDVEGDRATWDGFGSHAGSSAAKRELTDALEAVQHGLCGYCEIDLHPRDREIEHVIPRSDTARRGVERALDHTNMIACCLGGSVELRPPEIRDDPFRFSLPIADNISCGSAKGDKSGVDLVDPRNLRPIPSLFRVLDDGRVEPDVVACASCRVSIEDIDGTIATLGLNSPRLRTARASRWRELREQWEACDGDTRIMRAIAEYDLSPNEKGELPAFFTTTRSFFGPLAEDVLDDPALPWV